MFLKHSLLCKYTWAKPQLSHFLSKLLIVYVFYNTKKHLLLHHHLLIMLKKNTWIYIIRSTNIGFLLVPASFHVFVYNRLDYLHSTTYFVTTTYGNVQNKTSEVHVRLIEIPNLYITLISYFYPYNFKSTWYLICFHLFENYKLVPKNFRVFLKKPNVSSFTL